MEFCFCSICKQQKPKNTSSEHELEDGSYVYMCDDCINSPVRTAFCSMCFSTENLIQVYQNGDHGVYGCEKHFVEVYEIFG